MKQLNIIDELKKLFAVPSGRDESLMDIYILNRLRDIPDLEVFTDEIGNILVTKGHTDYFPCIICHKDTVHAGKKVRVHFDGEVFTSPDGIGGDDKCGIFACLYFLRTMKNVKAVFFTEEESGLTGSSNIDHNFLKDCGYIIQLDRYGNSDFIDQYFLNDTTSKEFSELAEPAKEKYGYKSCEGFITDSMNLFTHDVSISCVNISCGYYEHHTKKEYVILADLLNSILFTEELIKALGENQYKAECKRFNTFDNYRTYPGETYYDDLNEPRYKYYDYEERLAYVMDICGFPYNGSAVKEFCKLLTYEKERVMKEYYYHFLEI